MDFTNYLSRRSSNLATMKAKDIKLSTLTGSTLIIDTSITAPSMVYSTLTGSTIYGSTVVVSSITTSFLTLSTLVVSSINGLLPGTGSGGGSASTLTVSSLVSVSSISTASTIYGSSILITGNVGIGTNAPSASYALHVVGNIFATQDITAFSDQRYKQNIIRLEHSLDTIRSLSGYSYTREDYRPGERHIGLLAQEVLTVFPEAVNYDRTNEKYSVNYNCLMAPVIESIKELYDRAEAQAKTIDAQQSTIQQLVAHIGSL